MIILSATLALSLHFNPFSQTDALPRRGAFGVQMSPLAKEKAAAMKLKADTGLVVVRTLPGLTGDKAKLQAGDIIIEFNGKSVSAPKLSEMVRNTPSGSNVKILAFRDGKKIELTAPLQERPRDPGNANYDVSYSHITSFGKRMRTIITRPKSGGKHPALFFIQGFSPVSYDFILEGSKGDVSTIDGPILFDFANKNFVTIRVEKPGVGDSEGGPFNDLDYTTELDIYRQTLKQIKTDSAVDNDNIFIFGHSMGGAFGPMIAAESPVKGIATYGTAARTWFEYILDTVRYQGLVGGNSFENADEEIRQFSRLLALVFLERKSPAQVKKSHPQLAKLADDFFPNGLFNQKSLEFWRQLNDTNFASYWAKCNTHVLAVRGASDFVTYDADHKLIADIVNKANPGWGTFSIAPDSDHLFHNFPTEQESMKNFQKGKFNMNFSHMMMDWIKGVIAGK
jgi:pimeloyl-ACP methyl ester carboxylesterase